jgi:hypothetical protein
MGRMRPEYLDPHLPDHSVAGDVLVREEPDDEEDKPDEDDDPARKTMARAKTSDSRIDRVLIYLVGEG